MCIAGINSELLRVIVRLPERTCQRWQTRKVAMMMMKQRQTTPSESWNRHWSLFYLRCQLLTLWVPSQMRRLFSCVFITLCIEFCTGRTEKSKKLLNDAVTAEKQMKGEGYEAGKAWSGRRHAASEFLPSILFSPTIISHKIFGSQFTWKNL